MKPLPGDAYMIRNIYTTKSFGKTAVTTQRVVHDYKFYAEQQLALRMIS